MASSNSARKPPSNGSFFGSVSKLRSQSSSLNTVTSEIASTEDELNYITDGLPVIIACVDSNHRFVFSNKAHQQHWGRSKELIIGHHAKELLGESNYKEAKPYLEKAFEGVASTFEVKVKFPTIGQQYMKVDYIPHISESGEILGCFVLGQNISDQKQAEEALRLSEERFRRIVEMTHLIPWEADINTWDFTYVGPQAEKILGYPLEQWYSRNFWTDHLHPDDKEQAIEICTKNSKSKSTYEFEYRMIKADGGIVWLRDIASTFQKSNSVKYLQGFLIDITESKAAEEEKFELEKQLKHAQKMEALGQLAGGIAHDFNNILGGIIGYSELAIRRIENDSSLRTYLDHVHVSAYRAKDLVKQILTFSQRTRTDYNPINICKLVEEVLSLARASIPSTIEILKTIPETQHYILGDSGQIHQVLLNICTNAAHAMEANGGKLIVKLDLVTLDGRKTRDLNNISPGRYVRIKFDDSGHGMDPETQKRIFEPYFTTKAIGKGSGLGLSVAHGIVAAHNGGIHVSSMPGRGSSFELYLPWVEAPLIEMESPSESPALGRGRILFVDDEAVLAQLGKDMLETLGYEVLAFVDSSEALEFFSKYPLDFDLVITDQTMPGLTGDMLVKRLRQIRPELSVIVCSGYSPRLDSEAIHKQKNTYLLPKPFSILELAELTGKALRDSLP